MKCILIIYRKKTFSVASRIAILYFLYYMISFLSFVLIFLLENQPYSQFCM